ncbi:hypothetical protein QLX67_01165 [Balneolaceae bacterium ANBcel3]|nr:hypothetical protein [Balneolaceae bacterium ANBcel3]
MIRFIYTLLLLTAIVLLPAKQAEAQYRSDLESSLDRTGHIIRTFPESDQSSFLGLQHFQMNHSYEMRAGSFAGNAFNVNTYTNTMHFVFNDNLYSRVDLAMSHSPFGPGMPGSQNQTQFYIKNAEVNYRFSENSRIQVRFRQVPYGYGYGYNPYSPFSSPFYQQNRHSNPYYW